MSLNSHRNLGLVSNQQARSSQRLSSGFRINSAADDAAGLGISEKMRSQIRGLDQASRNAQDGISLIQTAEGAMSIINEMVTRIRELVVQAANDTNAHEDGNLAQSDRMRIQDEINQLMDEIDATRNRTQFNTRNLIDGSLSGGVSGSGSALTRAQLDAIAFHFVNTALDHPDLPGSGEEGSLFTAMQAIHYALGVITPGYFDAATGAWNDPVTNTGAIETTQNALNALLAERDAILAAQARFDTAAFQTELGSLIREQLVNLAANLPYGSSGITLAQANVFLTAIFGTTDDAFATVGDLNDFLGGTNTVINGAFLDSVRDDMISALGLVDGASGNIDDWATLTAIDVADITSGIGQAVNDAVTNLATATADLINARQYIDNWLGGLDADHALFGVSREDIETFVRGGQLAGQPGGALWFHVGANLNQGVRLSIEDVGTAALSAIGTNGQRADEIGEFTFARLRTIPSGNVVHGPGGPPIYDAAGGVINTEGEDIQRFIVAIDEALAHVTGQRSNLGAMQNRLEFTIESLDISSENLSAANSRIRDADMAQEMMRLTQANVLQQAAISMLAQANQAPQSILQLLG